MPLDNQILYWCFWSLPNENVVAWQGDIAENELLKTRVSGRLIRLLAKWITWSLLLEGATLLMMIPLLPDVANPKMLLKVWFYAGGEIAIFISLGLAIARYCKDPILAHSGALMVGFLMVVGGGILGYVFAWQPLLQKFPDLWTLFLMSHPVEALRVSVVFSADNLPFDARELPPVASIWLKHAGWWYFLLVLLWSSLSLGATVFRK